jgi:glutaredoxin 3
VTKIIMYGTKTCPWCKKTRAFFKKHKIEFKDNYVDKDEKARDEIVKKSKQMSVPVVEIKRSHGVEIIVGFDENKLKKALNLGEKK